MAGKGMSSNKLFSVRNERSVNAVAGLFHRHREV